MTTLPDFIPALSGPFRSWEMLVVKWQYRLHLVSVKSAGAMASTVDDGLNDLGTDGWEAVACMPNPESRFESYVLLKRPAG
jgi:hypothetical protein